jgi:hypothetical protein
MGICVYTLFGSFEMMNRAVYASFIFSTRMICTANGIENMHIFSRIIAEGIEMTIFQF